MWFIIRSHHPWYVLACVDMMFCVVDLTWVWIVRSCLNSHVSESHIVYLMWNITNDVVNPQCNSSNSHSHIAKFINCIQLTFNRERVQFKFHQNYKTEIFFFFFFLLENLTNISSFPTLFFIFFNQKNWDKNQECFFFFKLWVEIQRIFFHLVANFQQFFFDITNF